MLDGNLARIQYRAVHFFIGAYPNDPDTIAVIQKLQKRHVNVHLAMCPHDGPSSKADCLNWIYQRMLLFETENGIRFETLVTHDAEDVIHPDALHWINRYSGEYAMVQVPVLPLPTPLREWTHGVYCDEFAEYQARDMPARQWMQAFVPSNGVGTGFSRTALDQLASEECNRIFEPVCLTEDYENGLRLRLRGCRQLFLPIQWEGVATREYFPQNVHAAIRQRTRWVTGIILQSWERHGWKGNLATKYWLWRDRKGLIGNPASLLTNALCLYGSVSFCVAACSGCEWQLSETLSYAAPLFTTTTGLGVYRLLFRMNSTAQCFGWRFATGVPVRVVVANWINCNAAFRAVHRFAVSKLLGRPLTWVKTEHQYPSGAALLCDRRRIGEILAGSGYLPAEGLEQALATKPAGVRLGEHLISLGLITEADLYEALSLQQCLPQTQVARQEITSSVARALPESFIRRWHALPVRIDFGQIAIASTDVPSEGMRDHLASLTSLEVRFYLITPTNFRQIARDFL
jgi:adsorption protein B